MPTNIAEGCGAEGLEFARFLQMGMRSASELDYQLILARDLEYLEADRYGPLDRELGEVKRMLNALIHKVRKDVSDIKAGRHTQEAREWA